MPKKKLTRKAAIDKQLEALRKRLNTPEGIREVMKAVTKAREAGEKLRRAAQVTAEQLNRPITI